MSFSGWVAPADVPWLVNQHDVMIMPSRFEGFGLTLIEAMSQGCPAVVSKIAGVTDTIVTDGEDGLLFPVGDFRQAARHINRLARDRELLAGMAAAAQQKVETVFDNDIAGRAYAGLLEHLAEDRSSHCATTGAFAMVDAERTSFQFAQSLAKPVKNWLRQVRERLHTRWSAA